MTATEIIIAVLGIVQVATAVMLVVAFRQITLISLRVGLLQSPTAKPVLIAGSPLPDAVTAAVPSLAASPVTYVLWLTSQCASCRNLATQLIEQWSIDPIDDVLVLLSGNGSAVDSLAVELQRYTDVIRSPAADEVTGALALDTSPFMVEVEQGVITGWVTPDAPEDLDRLRKARSTSDAATWAERNTAADQSDRPPVSAATRTKGES